MTHLYLKSTTVFSLIFIILSLAARALGATQPPNPALRGFTEGCEDKPQPCWYGIVPGINTKEAKNILVNLGYDLRNPPLPSGAFEDILAYSESKCNLRLLASQRRGTIELPVVIQGKCLTLGDLFLFFGKPDYVYGEGIKSDYLPLMGYYDGYLLNPFPIQAHVLSPYTYFQLIEWTPNLVKTANISVVEWRNFIPIWKYCQLEFALSDCVEARAQQTAPLATLVPITSSSGLTTLPTLPPG